jgi:SNF2 family DNA or RNA helicase
MVVTKSAIKFQWFKQAVRWLGPEYIAQVISTSKDHLFPGLKLYIIPYDLLRRMKKDKLHALGINLVILDEVQQIKNPDSSRTQEVRKLVSANPECKVIELSGTPWKNRGSEFFPALNLINPFKFHSYQHYLDTWVDYYYEGPKKKMGGIRNIAKFKEYTQDIVIRREYNEVMDEFPDINRMKLNLQLDELNQSVYDDATSEFVAWYNEAVIGGEEDALNGMELLAKMARMRHITGLAKIPGTLSFVEEFVEDTDKKIVVFVHHKDVGQIMYDQLKNTDSKSNPDWYELADELNGRGIKVLKYTSDLSDVERFEMQEVFNKSPRVIMIASTLACGEGVDLQTCSDCILHERQWNPQNEDQAAPGRFRRIGQTAKVINITCPEAEGTIDEDLDVIVETKRRQFHAAMNKGEAPSWNEGQIAKELAEKIVARHKAKNKGVKSKQSLTAVATFK